MTKKYPKSEANQDSTIIGQEAYVTWGEDLESKKIALHTSSESLEEYVGIQKSTGSAARRHGFDYSNLDGTGTSGRPGLTRDDYDFFRPDEAVPRGNIKAILRRAEDIYQRIGLV